MTGFAYRELYCSAHFGNSGEMSHVETAVIYSACLR